MATATTRVLRDDDDHYIVQYTHVSDEAIESAVTKLDASTVFAGSKYFVEEIWWSTAGLRVHIHWVATTPVLLITCGSKDIGHVGHLDFSSFGGIPRPDTAGSTGDLTFTTQNPDTSDTYLIILKCRKIK